MSREPLYVSPAGAAELLGCSRALIYRLLRNEQIPSAKVGHLRRIPVAALNELARHEYGARDAS